MHLLFLYVLWEIHFLLFNFVSELLKGFTICWSIYFTTQNKQLVTNKESTSVKWLQNISKEKEMNCFEKPSKHVCLNLVR